LSISESHTSSRSTFEGYEEAVLSGSSLQPALLSFEFNAAYLPPTLRCLELSVFDQRSTFWMKKGELQKELSRPDGNDQGDISVRASE
jgi:hypothetical protein